MGRIRKNSIVIVINNIDLRELMIIVVALLGGSGRGERPIPCEWGPSVPRLYISGRLTDLLQCTS